MLLALLSPPLERLPPSSLDRRERGEPSPLLRRLTGVLDPLGEERTPDMPLLTKLSLRLLIPRPNCLGLVLLFGLSGGPGNLLPFGESTLAAFPLDGMGSDR